MQGSFHSPFPEVASLPQGVLFVCTSVKEAELSSRQGWTAVRGGPKERERGGGGREQRTQGDHRVGGYKEARMLMTALVMITGMI